MDGFDFGAPAATEEAPAPLDGGFDFGAPAAPAAVAPMDALAGFDMGATPAAAEGFDMGAAAEAAPAMGAMDAMAGFAPEEIPDEPAAEPAFTMNSFNPKLAEIEEKTQKDRQDRTNAASMKESEMKMEASAALEKFHADRKAAAAAKKEANLATEKAEAEALASETNPWNTVYKMVEGQPAAGATQQYNDILISLKEKGKA